MRPSYMAIVICWLVLRAFALTKRGGLQPGDGIMRKRSRDILIQLDLTVVFDKART